MRFVATFYTHLAAMLTCSTLQKAGVTAKLAPVPRRLSSSCGTCVFYGGDEPHLEAMDRDVEAVYRREGEGYACLYRGED